MTTRSTTPRPSTRRRRPPKAASSNGQPSEAQPEAQAPEGEAGEAPAEPEVAAEVEAEESEPPAEEHHEEAEDLEHSVSAEAAEDSEPEELWEGPGGALRRELWRRGQELFENLERIKEHDTEEAVHDLRVASRRLSSVLGLAAELIGSKPVRSARRQLAGMRRALGEVRDLQIQDEFLAQHQEDYPAYAGRLEELRALEGRAVRRAVKVLNRFQPRKLARRLEGIDALVAALVESSEGWGECLTMLWRATAERYAAVLAQRERTSSDDPASTHALRVVFKKFRYRAEVVGQLQDPPRPAEHGEQMKGVQRVLGGLQDLEVITRGLERYWVNCPPERESQLAALGHLLEHRRALLGEYHQQTLGVLEGLWELPPTEE